MPGVIVVGTQFGDEGKGKVVDLLTSKGKHIVRAQGGNNAGHTVMIGDEEYKLHLIPAGILHTHTECHIGAGTVIDLEVLVFELRSLQAKNIPLENRLWISPLAHVIFPYHRRLDLLQEKRKGERAIGTTGRGIGPCYADKALRIGIRMGELLDPKTFYQLLKNTLTIKNEEIVKLYGLEPFSFEEILSEYTRYAEQLRPYVFPIEEKIDRAFRAKENILFEGAQGTCLDNTFGTYPFVTASNTIASGVCAGAGVGPGRIRHVLGVVKAYTTRVGSGPLPTELRPGEIFPSHAVAREYGTTTRRKRRIGWFDANIVRTAVKLNGIDSIAVTKLDILDDLEKINICTSYRVNDKTFKSLPLLAKDQNRMEAHYETHAGWMSSTKNVKAYEDLPVQAKKFLQAIATSVQAPISLVSVGPKREQTIMLRDVFAE